MKLVVFTQPYRSTTAIYSPDERAGFPDQEADDLVKRGIARFDASPLSRAAQAIFSARKPKQGAAPTENEGA